MVNIYLDNRITQQDWGKCPNKRKLKEIHLNFNLFRQFDDGPPPEISAKLDLKRGDVEGAGLTKPGCSLQDLL